MSAQKKRTSGGRGRRAACFSAVKANTSFLLLKKTLSIHIRDQAKHLSNPEFSLNSFWLQIHSLVHAYLSSQSTARVCLNDNLSVFRWMSLISQLQWRVECIILWKYLQKTPAAVPSVKENWSEDWWRHSCHAAIQHTLQKSLKWHFCQMHLDPVYEKSGGLFLWCGLVTCVLHA